MHEIAVILQWVGILLLWLYIAGPAVVKFTHRIRTSNAPIVVDDHALSREARAYFDGIDPQLGELGFKRAALLYGEGAVKGLRSYSAIYTHAQRGQLAQLHVIHSSMQIKRASEFSTVSADGLIVETSNAKIVPTFSPVVQHKKLYAPTVQDVRLLHSLHAAREARYLKPSVERFLPSPGTEAGLSALATSLELWWQTDAGFYRRDVQPGVYLMTWTGAYLMSWKQLFPVHQILAWQQRRQAHQELSDAMQTPMTPSSPVRITHHVPFQVSEGFPVIFPD